MRSEIPSNARIKAVYFDAAGTLIKPARKVGESYSVIGEKYGIRVDAGDLAIRFRLCFDSAPHLAFPGAAAGELQQLERDWWKALVQRIFEPFGPLDHFDDYFAELFDYFAKPNAWALYPEVLDTLATLRKRGVTLAVISNFDSRLMQILDGLGIGSSFADVFVSSGVGYAKPDRRIFDNALNHHDIRAENAIHVGDSEINDLLGARGAGLKGLLIDRDSVGAHPADRLHSLQQIVAHLDG